MNYLEELESRKLIEICPKRKPAKSYRKYRQAVGGELLYTSILLPHRLAGSVRDVS